jgi:GTP-binding protein LepA
VDELTAGEVGYLMAGLKQVGDTKVGDTITEAARPADVPLPGYQDVKPMVFCGLYPADDNSYEDLRDALEKLQLNDSAFSFEPETSLALGFGFRCGFLGLLHMEIVQERLEREFGVDLITTVPNVKYQVELTDGTSLAVESPTALPDPGRMASVSEPIVRARIVCPAEYIGNVQKLCHERRGVFRGMSYLDTERVELDFELPLSEIVLDFYDRLKSGTRGYAALDYEFLEFRADDLVRLDILVNGDPVDAFSVIIHESKAYVHGRDLVRKLKDLIPQQQFAVALQAAIGNNVVARTNVKALRKNVTAKCYGGDITRKRKLLERQKEGKRRMKQVGTVEIPQEAFLAVLNLGDD